MRILLLSNRKIGQTCYNWLARQHPDKVIMLSATVDNIDFSQFDLVISTLCQHVIPAEAFNGKTRFYNFHPALLPEYAGSGGCSWAILNGEGYGGVTLHELVEKVDAGKVIDKKEVSIGEEDTAKDLFEKTEGAMFVLFKEWVNILMQGAPEGRPQQGEKTFYPRKKLLDSLNITRLVRAFTFEGKPSAYFKTRDGRVFYLDYEKGAYEKTK